MVSNIKIYTLKRVRRGPFATKGKIGASVSVMNDGYYSRFLERGTKERNQWRNVKYGVGIRGGRKIISRDIGRRTGKIEAGKFDFMKPAAERHRASAPADFSAALKEAAAETRARNDRKKQRAQRKFYKSTKQRLVNWGLEGDMADKLAARLAGV